MVNEASGSLSVELKIQWLGGSTIDPEGVDQMACW